MCVSFAQRADANAHTYVRIDRLEVAASVPGCPRSQYARSTRGDSFCKTTAFASGLVVLVCVYLFFF